MNALSKNRRYRRNALDRRSFTKSALAATVSSALGPAWGRDPRGGDIVGSGNGPSAPANLQLINQGGPNNAPSTGKYAFQGFTNYYSADSSANYQGFSWLAATAGTSPISFYKIYRATGYGSALSPYDTIATPITITGYIAPGTDASRAACGVLTVTAVSGGKTSTADGKILPGLALTSSASGFVSGTRVVLYNTGVTGGGGTGRYNVNYSQTVGSSGSHATFTAWSYNDTRSTNCNYFGFNGAGVVYAYAVSAVDTQGNEGPKAYPNAYMYYGYSDCLFASFTSGTATQNWGDTSGSPVYGPYDVYIQQGASGGIFLPVWAGPAPYPPYGEGSTPGTLCPSERFENGAFNYVVFDIKPTDNTFATSSLTYFGVTRAYGNAAGGDSNFWRSIDCRPYCTPPLSPGQWSTCKIPFSALTYGWSYATGSFAATSRYNGTLTITKFTSLVNSLGPDGCAYVGGPGIPANTYMNMSAFAGNLRPPSGAGPFVYTVLGPNIAGTETGSGSYTFQNTSCYKHGLSPYPGDAPGGAFYINRYGFSTV
jgi:hypothetical protein